MSAAPPPGGRMAEGASSIRRRQALGPAEAPIGQGDRTPTFAPTHGAIRPSTRPLEPIWRIGSATSDLPLVLAWIDPAKHLAPRLEHRKHSPRPPRPRPAATARPTSME